jgi:hypothetical protein
MQRDYILRLIEQVAQLLSRAVRQREDNSPQESLQSIMAACERLFGVEAVQLFQFTPEQHVAMLADGEDPEVAHDKILMYAALNEQAGQCYQRLGQPTLSQQSFLNALRFSLKARHQFPGFDAPPFAPSEAQLLRAIGDLPLDSELQELIAATRKENAGS